MAEWLRQGPAKPSTWVRFPASPPLSSAEGGAEEDEGHPSSGDVQACSVVEQRLEGGRRQLGVSAVDAIRIGVADRYQAVLPVEGQCGPIWWLPRSEGHERFTEFDGPEAGLVVQVDGDIGVGGPGSEGFGDER